MIYLLGLGDDSVVVTSAVVVASAAVEDVTVLCAVVSSSTVLTVRKHIKIQLLNINRRFHFYYLPFQ